MCSALRLGGASVRAPPSLTGEDGPEPDGGRYFGQGQLKPILCDMAGPVT
jgi:hypothetical protein